MLSKNQGGQLEARVFLGVCGKELRLRIGKCPCGCFSARERSSAQHPLPLDCPGFSTAPENVHKFVAYCTHHLVLLHYSSLCSTHPQVTLTLFFHFCPQTSSRNRTMGGYSRPLRAVGFYPGEALAQQAQGKGSLSACLVSSRSKC